MTLYKWVLDVPDAGLKALVVVLDESPETAKERAVAFARERGLWGNWFQKQQPQPIRTDEPAVVAWAEFSR